MQKVIPTKFCKLCIASYQKLKILQTSMQKIPKFLKKTLYKY